MGSVKGRQGAPWEGAWVRCSGGKDTAVLHEDVLCAVKSSWNEPAFFCEIP